MYKKFNDIEKIKLNKVFDEFKQYFSNSYEVKICDISFEYSLENTYVNIGFKTIDYIKISKIFDYHYLTNFQLDIASNKTLHNTFNDLLENHELKEFASKRLRVLFYDYERQNKDNCFKNVVFNLNFRNDYFKNSKKLDFAYGINNDNNVTLYSIILIYKKERYYIDAIKEDNFLKIKEECFNTVKIFDKDNWYNWDNFILFITFEDVLTSTVQRAGDLIINNKDEALFLRV